MHSIRHMEDSTFELGLTKHTTCRTKQNCQKIQRQHDRMYTNTKHDFLHESLTGTSGVLKTASKAKTVFQFPTENRPLQKMAWGLGARKNSPFFPHACTEHPTHHPGAKLGLRLY